VTARTQIERGRVEDAWKELVHARDLPAARSCFPIHEALVSLTQEGPTRAGRALDAALEAVQLMLAAVATQDGATAIH